ncbi:hypothetical protein HN51_029695 [Arachis hypogaea]|uniref:Dirigent protein n=2 Tax=Arachis hypogaea TaxID=3818 RepID=A0A445BDX3_ARAHY|nr:dirigent protein 25 [Arachis hypogaea]RYR36849.1 hypothetical protein Ahy_A09g041802 [Arachis hypogaea]
MKELAMLLLFMTTINQCSSARTLGNSTQNHNHAHHHRITFLMRDILNNVTYSRPPKKPATTKVTGQLPFQKPLGLFPPNGAIPIPQSTQQTLALSNFGFSFPTRATLQELEFGSVTSIDEELLQVGAELEKLGQVQGVYVASSGDRTSHMMAITARFLKGDEYQDGLTIFGVHRTDVLESHVAVIGGTGKYNGANGYAAVKVVDRVGSNAEGGKVTSSKFLLFDVYLS